MRCNRKASFNYKGKLQEVFRAGLNEIKYDYVDSKQLFYAQYDVAATDIETTLQKKQTTLQTVAYLGFNAWGQTQFKRSHPARSWQHKIKETLQSDALLQLSNSKEKIFLPLLLKLYRLYCHKADKQAPREGVQPGRRPGAHKCLGGP